MADTLKVLVGSNDPDFHAQVRGLSDRIELYTPDDLRAEPALLPELEVAFGGLSRAHYAQATGLKWLQTAGAGVDGLLTEELRAGELIVTNASGIHAEPIAEHMFGMLLMITRRLGEAWDQQKTRQWRGYDFGSRVEILSGKTLGVLGVGAIGGHAARIGRAFGMKVVGLRRSGQPHQYVERMFRPNQVTEFFRECDVVMSTLPLTEKTRYFVSRAELTAMKKGGIFINTGRGETVHTDSLMEVMQRGYLRAALLDVTDPEPLPEDHPLWTTPNVYITPHYSGSHPGYQQRAGKIFLENLRRYLAGETLMNIVDKAEGY
jgi:phosphoglycerate dehydrogenase-like enzyme